MGEVLLGLAIPIGMVVVAVFALWMDHMETVERLRMGREEMEKEDD